MDNTWDVSTVRVITHANMKRVEESCEPYIVVRRNSSGKFATLRAAQEYLAGRIMFQGRYRSRLEIMEYLRATPCWAHSVIEPRTDGWRFIHPEGAEMFLRAS